MRKVVLSWPHLTDTFHIFGQARQLSAGLADLIYGRRLSMLYVTLYAGLGVAILFGVYLITGPFRNNDDFYW